MSKIIEECKKVYKLDDGTAVFHKEKSCWDTNCKRSFFAKVFHPFFMKNVVANHNVLVEEKKEEGKQRNIPYKLEPVRNPLESMRSPLERV
jgi:hypothetical protein